MSVIGNEVTLIVDQIATDILGALGISKIHYESPRKVQDEVPYAVIEIVDIDESLDDGAGTQVQISLTIEITLNLAIPALGDPITNILLFKIAKADLLTARLMPGPRYANFAELPTVPKRVFKELDDVQDDRVQLRLEFQCQFLVDHH